MSEKKDKHGKPVKRWGLGKLLIMALLVAGTTGGTIFGLMASGIIKMHSAEARDRSPELVLKGHADPYAPPSDDHGKEKPEVVYGDGGSRYRTAYYSFGDEFTSNLRDTNSLIQVSLAASTRYDGRVLMWLGEHELAIRSRILVSLADTPEEDIHTPEGKKRLQQRLTKVVNEVLTEQEGFGGVDNVFFRSLIVQ